MTSRMGKAWTRARVVPEHLLFWHLSIVSFHHKGKLLQLIVGLVSGSPAGSDMGVWDSILHEKTAGK